MLPARHWHRGPRRPLIETAAKQSLFFASLRQSSSLLLVLLLVLLLPAAKMQCSLPHSHLVLCVNAPAGPLAHDGPHVKQETPRQAQLLNIYPELME